MKPKPFRIFRVGKHTDSAGVAHEFTREQMEKTIAAYNEGDWRAPMVVGHPQGNAPAYGWISKLSIDEGGDIFVDDVEQLNPDFAELMKSGAYRNRSASWYSPEHPNNPSPGLWQLRHLGMLGAQPPAVKGLKDVQFNDGAGVVIDFEEHTASSLSRTLRSLREFLLSRFGIEDADRVIPNWEIETVEREAQKTDAEIEAKANQEASYSEPNNHESEVVQMTPEQIAELQEKASRADQLQSDYEAEKAARLAAENNVASYQEAQKKLAHDAAVSEAKTLLAPLVNAGKLLPNQLEAAANFMAGLDNETASFDFSDAGGQPPVTALGLFKSLLQVLPSQVDYSEATGEDAGILPGDMTAEQLTEKAKAYAADMQEKRGITVTTVEAVNAVLAGKTA